MTALWFALGGGFMITMIVFVFGALMYRIDRNSETMMAALFYICLTFTVTIGLIICYMYLK